MIALMFDENLAKEKEEKGFFGNPYDPCVENLTIHRIHITIFWHVNDLNSLTLIQ